jgi:very-short-patch-repair endonuclease
VTGAIVCGYVVDALFVEERLIVELDSWEFHKDPIAFQTDRERDAETLAHGFGTLRITWERIEQAPSREAPRLGKILAQRRQLLSAVKLGLSDPGG